MNVFTNSQISFATNVTSNEYYSDWLHFKGIKLIFPYELYHKYIIEIMIHDFTGPLNDTVDQKLIHRGKKIS